jgi:type 1 glutamine amidotransferase
LAAAVALACWAALAGTDPSPAGEHPPPPKIRVLLIDGQNNHDWRSTTPILKKCLEDTGRFYVQVSSNLKPGDAPGKVTPTFPFPPNLESYTVLVSNYNGDPWPKEFQADVAARVAEGKLGLVVVHAADNAFSGWPEWNDMIGLGWRDNRFGERLILDAGGHETRVAKGTGPGAGHGAKHAFKVTVRDAEHPITRGMPAEWLHAPDELYHGLRGPAKNMHVLATAFSDKSKGGTGENEPMIWTLSYEKGRVFHTPMGHDVESMRCVGFQATVARGTEWAATGKVTLALPEKFPTADKVSSVPTK